MHQPSRPDATAREHHPHYDHYSPAMADRLDGFFGRVDDRRNLRIAASVSGDSVLEVGCGFGSLTEHLRLEGMRATGVDLLAECITAGGLRYPLADLRLSASEDLAFADASFDTVVLKDTIHHIYAEDDVAVFLRAVRRIARKRVVILDPNPMGILLLARRMIGHVDPVCGPADAARVVRDAGFAPLPALYSELFAFPLSGGYVGPRMVPAHPRVLGTALLALDAALFAAAEAVGLGPHLGWRYLLAADVA